MFYTIGMDVATVEKTVTVSPKYQIVIPKLVREAMGILPGQKLRFLAFDGQIHLVPVRPLKSLMGSLKGMPIHFEREKEDRY